MYCAWSKSDVMDFKEAQRERRALYLKTDKILYDMCRRWPHHNDLGEIQAKVRIIGRVYATGLERKGEEDKSKGIYETVGEVLFKQRNFIDSQLNEIRKFRRFFRISGEKMLAFHGKLVKLIRDGTDSKRNFRSFVSKYLHFHAPIVPIFDNRASTTINHKDWYPWNKNRNKVLITKKRTYDPVYFKFLNQFLMYFADLQKQRLNPTVRTADYFLIWSKEYLNK